MVVAPVMVGLLAFVAASCSKHEQAKLTAADGAAGDLFGWSVAISGSRVVAGAPEADIGTTYSQGAAYVFVRSLPPFWSQQAKLTARDGVFWDDFGWSVAISGYEVAVGAPMQYASNAFSVRAGAAYVFIWSNGIWSQEAKLSVVNGGRDDWFGNSIAIDSGTGTVVAGAPYRANSNRGSAYVFVR